MYNIFQNKINQKKSMKKLKPDGELARLQRLIKNEIKEKYSSKLKLYIIDTGSCGACELELKALFNPLYDVQSIGIEVVYDISNADILFLTGVLTENIYTICLDAYNGLKEPKHVITVGDCIFLHSPFINSFAIKSQANIHFLSETHISGCPPDPKALLRGILKYLQEVV